MAEEKKRLDVHTTSSNKKGVWGSMEKLLRQFKHLGTVFILFPIIVCYVLSLAFSVLPCVYFLLYLWNLTADSSIIIQGAALSLGIGISFVIFIMGMLLVVPFFNWLLLLPVGKVKPMRVIGYSLDTVPWYYHNAMVQLARYTVLDFLAPTPFLVLFYKLMGMKIGKGVVINSTNISDPALITLEDHVVIGGSATIFAHYGMHGFLIVSQTIIKKGATVGLKASVMGDVIVGENQTVEPGITLLPKTRLPDISRNKK
ncbi:MAG: hypothetical protein H6621_05405 [Halobacteriovoraceae bacterium]|nr:hypothetical protein [Halobacteriovoraceae bacterium]